VLLCQALEGEVAQVRHVQLDLGHGHALQLGGSHVLIQQVIWKAEGGGGMRISSGSWHSLKASYTLKESKMP
jgi:hypothetical protein